jgi:hypothetical protein
MTGSFEHHFSADNEFNRFAKRSGRRRGQRAMRPWKKFASETRTNKPGDDVNAFFRQVEHLGKNSPKIEHALRLLINSQLRLPRLRLFL